MKRIAVLSMAVVLTASSVAGAEKWWDFYKRGTGAIARSDWPTVADQMSKSIALKSGEELAARVSRNEAVVYVPHFWLGVARFNMGDVEGAIREWDISQGQGVIQKTQYYPDLRSYLARSQAQKAKGVAALSADARKAAEVALNRAIGSQVQAISGGGDRSESYRMASRRLQEAWDQFNKAGNDSKAYARAAETAGKSRELFEAAAAEAASRKVAKAAPRGRVTPPPSQTTVVVPPPPQSAVVVPPPPEQEATPPKIVMPDVVAVVEEKAPPENPDLDPDLNRVRSLLAEFQQKLDRAAGSGANHAGLDQFLRSQETKVKQWRAVLAQDPSRKKTAEIEKVLAGLDRELSQRLTRIAAAAPTLASTSGRYVPSATIRAELKKAYIAYASGKLEESEKMLTKIVGKDPRADEAYLLRGAVRFTRLTLSGRKDPPMEEASADFRAALERDRTLTLDPVYFSPKLIAFFGQVRQAATHR